MKISIIAAIAKDTRVLGKDNKLLWHIPADLQHFKKLTSGHPIIMGRKTFDSILSYLKKPLPNRTNIVITRDTTYAPEGVCVAHSLEEAIEIAQTSPGSDEIFIGGGGEIYKQALSVADQLYLTLVNYSGDGDTFFPEYESLFPKSKTIDSGTHDGLGFEIKVLEK